MITGLVICNTGLVTLALSAPVEGGDLAVLPVCSCSASAWVSP